MVVLLSGRAADELFSGGGTTGAADDLEKVTKMAYAMVTQLGLGHELGLLAYQQRGDQFFKPFSEDTGRLIDREARTMVEQQYDRAKGLLSEHSASVQALASALEEREALTRDEIQEVIGHAAAQRSADEKAEQPEDAPKITEKVKPERRRVWLTVVLLLSLATTGLLLWIAYAPNEDATSGDI